MEFLGPRVANRIVNEVRGINRDVTSTAKPSRQCAA
jgi:hypothetical protein